MGLTRRAFLGGISLALGAGGAALTVGPGSYYQALAQPTDRKLALLIGINQYPETALDTVSNPDAGLRGCETDVALQRELLIHRFGFQASAILTLTNQQATRAAILEAIAQHLVAQARPGDVVLLHFSGYGSQVQLQTDPDQPYLAWVTVDSRLPTEQDPTLGDLLELEVISQLQGLATNNLTTVIDAGYQDIGYNRHGNLRVRSRPSVPTALWPPGLSPSRALSWPGTLLRAATPGHLVLEGQWDGLSAGIFTYALTQGLWTELPNPNPHLWVQDLGNRSRRWVGSEQNPSWSSVVRQKATAYTLPAQMTAADGVVLSAPGGDRPLVLWLGGLDPVVLSYLQPGSELVIRPPVGQGIPGEGPAPVQLRLESRMGVKATARALAPGVSLPIPSQPVYEKVRLLPRALDLVVAIDNRLQRFERVDATSALAAIPFVTAISQGDKGADCLFGRLLSPTPPTLTAALSPPESPVEPLQEKPDLIVPNRYGLFTPNCHQLASSWTTRDEAVKTAVARLTPQFHGLLALKLVRLCANLQASWLGATASLETVGSKPQLLIEQCSDRGETPFPSFNRRTIDNSDQSPVPMLASTTKLLYRVTSLRTDRLEGLLIQFDGQGQCHVLLVPAITTASNIGNGSGGRASLGFTLPDDSEGIPVPPTPGLVESYLVLNRRSFDHCHQALGENGQNPTQGSLVQIPQPLPLAQALLEDLHSGPPGSDHYRLCHDQWVCFNFNYRITPEVT
ncbi:MAG: caspase family protein [Nodosilinea sp.]